MRWLLLALLLPLLAVGCTLEDGAGDYREQVVVQSFLIAGDTLPEVRLSTTAPIGEAYDVARRGIERANVQIELLGADGTVETTLPYVGGVGGVYHPFDPTARVQPRRTYQLRASFPDRPERITARTTVPDTFRVVRRSADTLTYLGEQLFLDLTRVPPPPGRQAVFVFSTLSLAPKAANLTPFLRARYDDDSTAFKLNERIINESPIINEANYTLNPDGTVGLRLPWIAVAFYGPNVTIANALDDNLYDFYRSQAVQAGGSTLAPGEIQSVITHIDGGTGLFGSLSRVSVPIYVRRPDGRPIARTGR